MLGAIIGDIAGSRFEFNNTNDYDFELFHKDCSFTDDTICTVAIADAIMNKKSYKESLVEWCKKYPHPMGGYGARFSEWIHDPVPYGSWGNGAAMRVSPVGWLFDREEGVKIEAMKTAEVSHNHSEGLKGAQVVALAIFYLRTMKSVSTVGNMLFDLYTSEHNRKWWPKEGVWCDNCQGSVPLSLNLFLQSTSFEDAIRKAVSYGGDSDTIGAIVGSLAEAYYGIPDDFKQKALTYLPDDMKEVIHKFYATINK